MYSFDFNNVKAEHELTELIKMFFPVSDFKVLAASDSIEPESTDAKEGGYIIKIPAEITDKEEGKRYIYRELNRITGKSLPWGTLTGIRPVKLTGEIFKEGNNEAQVLQILKSKYLVSHEKAELLNDIRKRQEPYLQNKDEKAFALYLGIPFCPTRCLYCSFPAYVSSQDKVRDYLKALYREIEAIGGLMREKACYPQSVYIGGGTPTSLEAGELAGLLEKIRENFDLDKLEEYTLEAGRPDTITAEKLLEIKDKGVDRISINPQTSNEKTLQTIGRCHTNKELYKAFETAKTIGFKGINADLIAGLPGESLSDFEKSLKDIIDLSPENITVHTLAVKRASRLKESNPFYSYEQGRDCEEMLELGAGLLKDRGYLPYYLYRQKQMMSNLENVGYSIPGRESLYNIRIMEEDQTIIALGAGGVSKIYYPAENRLERVPNVSNYEVYIDKIDEMIERKRKEIG